MLIKQKPTWKFLALATVALVSLPVANAQAQLPTDAERAATGTASAGRIDQQLKESTVVPTMSPKIQVRNAAAQKAPAGAENIKFTLNSISMDGVSVYGANDLKSVYATDLGQEITLADLYGIAADLTRKYRNDGYILTQVVVPPQTIQSGNVSLKVVEGYIDTVSVQGAGQESEMSLVRTYASQVSQNGAALNAADLERHLLLINDLPGVDARAIISPSPSKVGGADLRIIVERDPYDALLAFDNYGSRYLGPYQFSAAGAANSVLGYNERISAQVVWAPDVDATELAYGSVTYEQPIFDYGTKASFTYSYTDTTPGYNLEQFDVEGRSKLMRAKVEHPFIRSRSENLYGHLLFDWRDVDSSNNLEPTRRDRIRALRAGGRYEFLDTTLGIGVNSINVELSRGLEIMGASEEGDARLTRGFGNPQFTKVSAEFQRLQRVTDSINVLGVIRGQLSSGPLLASEEFGVGGINIGRGFDPSEIVGDEGVAGKLEVQWNHPYPWDLVDDYEVYGFFDAGHIRNDDATTSSGERDTLTSTGIGLRADFPQNTKAGFAVAFPLNRDVDTQKDKDPRVYFNLSKGF